MHSDIIEAAYTHQTRCDPRHTAQYFTHLMRIHHHLSLSPSLTSFSLSGLELLLTTERSNGRWGIDELYSALTALGLGPKGEYLADLEVDFWNPDARVNAEIEESFVLNAYKHRCAASLSPVTVGPMDQTVHETILRAGIDPRSEDGGKAYRRALREHLGVIAEFVGSERMKAVSTTSDDEEILTPEKAAEFLGVPREFEDEGMLITVYGMRVRSCASVLRVSGVLMWWWCGARVW